MAPPPFGYKGAYASCTNPAVVYDYHNENPLLDFLGSFFGPSLAELFKAFQPDPATSTSLTPTLPMQAVPEETTDISQLIGCILPEPKPVPPEQPMQFVLAHEGDSIVVAHGSRTTVVAEATGRGDVPTITVTSQGSYNDLTVHSGRDTRVNVTVEGGDADLYGIKALTALGGNVTASMADTGSHTSLTGWGYLNLTMGDGADSLSLFRHTQDGSQLGQLEVAKGVYAVVHDYDAGTGDTLQAVGPYQLIDIGDDVLFNSGASQVRLVGVAEVGDVVVQGFIG